MRRTHIEERTTIVVQLMFSRHMGFFGVYPPKRTWHGSAWPLSRSLLQASRKAQMRRVCLSLASARPLLAFSVGRVAHGLWLHVTFAGGGFPRLPPHPHDVASSFVSPG